MFQKKTTKAFLAIAAIGFSVLALFFEFHNFEVSEIQQASKSAVSSFGHIHYFGYYGSAMGGLEDVTQETSDHANLTWIAYDGPQDVAKKLKEAQSLNMKVVIDLQLTFFDSNGNLLSNYQENWQEMADAIAPYIGSVAAFYPMDEPYGNARVHKFNIKKRLSQLNTIAATLKSTYPGIPIAVIFEIDTIKKNDPLPNFDWFGVDCYHKFSNCGGYSIGSYFFSLAARLHYGQSLIVVPWAFTAKDYPTSEGALIKEAQEYYNLALRFPNVIAVVPFIYQTFVGSDGIKMTGVQSMPQLRQAWVSIARQIDPTRSAPTNLPTLPDLSKNDSSSSGQDSSAKAVIRADREAGCNRVSTAGRMMIECR